MAMDTMNFSINPQAFELNKTGADLQQKGDLTGAGLHYLATLDIDYSFSLAFANYATVLNSQGKLVSAAACVRRFLEFHPDAGPQWSNYGNILDRLHKYSEAETALKKGIELCPDAISSWYNLSLFYHRCQKYQQALDCLEKVIALGANDLSVINDRAHMVLSLGKDLHYGLQLYEARWKELTHLPPWDFHIPEWQGEDLNGKRLLLHGEQGFGDSIMCARFARNLVDAGAIVTLGLPKSLCSLFDYQEWKNVSTLAIEEMNEENMNNKFDYQSPMFSAMYHLNISWETIDSAAYLTSPLITLPVVDKRFFNIGICWGSGKRNTQLDWRRREAPLEHWLQFTELPPVRLWSLQQGHNAEDINNTGAEALVFSHMQHCDDWAATAAHVAQLDLVITVDTAIAHLSAALGKETWMLAQYSNCWRWRDINNNTGLPWYSCMKVFHQKTPDDWKPLLDEAKLLLIERFNP